MQEVNLKVLAKKICDALINGKFQHPCIEVVDEQGFHDFCEERANNLAMQIYLLMEESKNV